MTTEQGSEVEFWELLKIYFMILHKTSLEGEEKMENGSNFIFLTWNYGPVIYSPVSVNWQQIFSYDCRTFPDLSEVNVLREHMG